MAKYIIDIEDEPVNGLYKAKNFNTLMFDEEGLERLVRADIKYWYLDENWEIQCGEFFVLDEKMHEPIRYGNYFFSKNQAEHFKRFCEAEASRVRGVFK